MNEDTHRLHIKHRQSLSRLCAMDVTSQFRWAKDVQKMGCTTSFVNGRYHSLKMNLPNLRPRFMKININFSLVVNWLTLYLHLEDLKWDLLLITSHRKQFARRILLILN
jgi:hypothetical protein